MQRFSFWFEHIKGVDNSVADWFSRLACLHLCGMELDTLDTFFALSLNALIEAEGEDDDNGFCAFTLDEDEDDFSIPLELFPLFCAVDSFLNASEEGEVEEIKRKKKDCAKILQQQLKDMPEGHFKNPEEVLKLVHNTFQGHFGIRKTYEKLCEAFPEHQIPVHVIQDFIDKCMVCAKTRAGMVGHLRCPTRVLRSGGDENTAGIDTLTISPHSRNGSVAIIVIVSFFQKTVTLYPVKNHGKEELASAMLIHCSRHGIHDFWAHDPGSDLMSDAIDLLNTWLGIGRRVGLTGRSTSNGVEHWGREVIRHLRAFVHDKRLTADWDLPWLIALMEMVFNSMVNPETRHTSYEMRLGSKMGARFDISDDLPVWKKADKHIVKLNSTLKTIRAIAGENMEKFKADKLAQNTPATRVNFQPGDLVLREAVGRQQKVRLPHTKLSPVFLGPFAVIQSKGNDVEVKHLSGGAHSFLMREELKMFFGSRVEALEAARKDYGQFVVLSIDGYVGDPITRSTMEYLVRFEDGDERFLVHSKDVTDTVAFADFCAERPECRALLKSAKAAHEQVQKLRASVLNSVGQHQTFLFNLRVLGQLWYDDLELPNWRKHTYVIELRVLDITNKQKRAVMGSELYKNEKWIFSNYEFLFYALAASPAHTIVTSELIREHPQLIRNTPIGMMISSELALNSESKVQSDSSDGIVSMSEPESENSEVPEFLTRWADGTLRDANGERWLLIDAGAGDIVNLMNEHQCTLAVKYIQDVENKVNGVGAIPIDTNWVALCTPSPQRLPIYSYDGHDQVHVAAILVGHMSEPYVANLPGGITFNGTGHDVPWWLRHYPHPYPPIFHCPDIPQEYISLALLMLRGYAVYSGPDGVFVTLACETPVLLQHQEHRYECALRGHAIDEVRRTCRIEGCYFNGSPYMKLSDACNLGYFGESGMPRWQGVGEAYRVPTTLQGRPVADDYVPPVMQVPSADDGYYSDGDMATANRNYQRAVRRDPDRIMPRNRPYLPAPTMLSRAPLILNGPEEMYVFLDRFGYVDHLADHDPFAMPPLNGEFPEHPDVEEEPEVEDQNWGWGPEMIIQAQQAPVVAHWGAPVPAFGEEPVYEAPIIPVWDPDQPSRRAQP
jgi:hypothetical protein